MTRCFSTCWPHCRATAPPSEAEAEQVVRADIDEDPVGQHIPADEAVDVLAPQRRFDDRLLKRDLVTLDDEPSWRMQGRPEPNSPARSSSCRFVPLWGSPAQPLLVHEIPGDGRPSHARASALI